MPVSLEDRIKNRALYYLAKRDYSRRELLDKLEKAFPESKELALAAIEECTALGYLDNTRFLEGRIRHRLAQGYGKSRILHELAERHGFAKTEILAALEAEIPANDQSPLNTLIHKKCATADLNDDKIRARLYRHLLGRGFQYEEIKEALKRFKAER